MRRWRTSSNVKPICVSDLVIVERKGSQKRNMEYVSPYSVHNNTGYRIQISDQIDPSRVYVLENGESMNYEIQQDMNKIVDETREDDLLNDYKVRLHFIEHMTDIIDNVNLDRVRVQRKMIRIKSNQNQQAHSDKYVDNSEMKYLDQIL